MRACTCCSSIATRSCNSRDFAALFENPRRGAMESKREGGE